MFFFLHAISISFAEEDPDDEIVVEDTKKTVDQIGSISIVNTQDSLAQSDLGDLLSLQPSVTIRRFGGLGAYSTLSVRGASSKQTTILIDDIPLNPEGSSSINISELPLNAFSTIELYRSHVPLYLQSSSIGGAVNLRPKTNTNNAFSFGYGSFETGSAEIETVQPYQKHHVLIFLRHFQTDGDFQYFDDNATIYNPNDDQFRHRSNNERQQQNILLYDTWKQFSMLHNTHLQQGGVAGSVIRPFEEVSLSTSRHLSSLRWKNIFDYSAHEIAAWHLLERSIIIDNQGEISGGPLSEYQRIHNIGTKGFHQLLLWPSITPSFGWQSRWEQNKNQDQITQDNRIESQRLVSSLQFGSQSLLLDDRFENHSALQLYHFFSSNQHRLFLTPKTSISFRCTDTVLFWSSASKSFRPPTMMELYGNQASIVGNEALRPETSISLDGGLVFSNETLSLQIGYFNRKGTDDIILIQNAQNQSIPFNFASTRIQGSEQYLRIHPHDILTWNLGLTWNHSINLSDLSSLKNNELPNIPRWNISHQLQIQHNRLALKHQWSLIDQTYVDATNHYLYPTRTFHNIELSIDQKNSFPSVSLSIRNLDNRMTEEAVIDPLQPDLGLRQQAISDFIGYPLSSRQIFLTLNWNQESP